MDITEAQAEGRGRCGGSEGYLAEAQEIDPDRQLGGVGCPSQMENGSVRAGQEACQ